MTIPTPEQADKLRRSISRLIYRHGWQPFAEGLHQVCKTAAKIQQGYPEAAATWQHRAATLQTIANNETHQ